VRGQLPAILHNSLKGRQTVFSIHAPLVSEVVENPGRFSQYIDAPDIKAKAAYISRLSEGRVPGINSPTFEVAVRKVLSFYYPGLVKLATTNAQIGADTDLKTDLPGGVVVRVQVKCFQDSQGPLSASVVTQLRDSMDVGENGIIVTTNRISEEAQQAAAVDSERPINFIDVAEFAALVFENKPELDARDLWHLGLRQVIEVR